MSHVIHEFLIWGAVATGFIAAILWYASTVVYEPSVGTSGFGALLDGDLVVPGPRKGTRADLIGSLQKQSGMSKRAAIVTGISILMQAMSGVVS